jgi:hypothetical protein
MAAYAVRWVDYARDQRDALPDEARRELDAALRRLVVDPARTSPSGSATAAQIASHARGLARHQRRPVQVFPVSAAVPGQP